MITIRKNPLNYFEDIDLIFDNILNNPLKTKGAINYYIKEDEKSIFLEMAIPGSNKKNIKLSYNNGYINISNEPKENDNSVWNKKFNEYINIGKNIDSKKINAKFQNGIIYITIPKKNYKETETIININ
ncbi:MAG: hypothetical protein CBC73_01130 [Flavobacteriales bacterium TMED113]|nr:MAG: hypothetical protein CBC73_01130 [Flavobacteriales bacterium TMED113]|tara:strand:- start:454 stop:840 length:387 start_codon:yes stop_codon:yes gene_type:complete